MASTTPVATPKVQPPGGASVATGAVLQRQPSRLASVVFNLLDPASFGFFVAALIFDVAYAMNADVLWLKAAAWLIVLGLVTAILPRFINLARVWFGRGRPRRIAEMAAFFFGLLGIVAAIFNAFVHSRDAYAAMPEAVWLSVVTVLLLVAANVTLTLQSAHHEKAQP